MSGLSVIPAAINAGFTLLNFLEECKDAPSDVQQLQLEMSLLCPILEQLQSAQANFNGKQIDPNQPAGRLPEEIESQLCAVLMSCMDTFRDITVLLRKYTKGKRTLTTMSKMRWSLRGQHQAEKLRRTLETHKATLSIAVGLITQTTVATTAQTINQVYGNTETIITQIHDLIARLDPDDAATVVAQAPSEASYTLRRFLSCASSYAESTIPEERRQRKLYRSGLGSISEAETLRGVALYDAPVRRDVVEDDDDEEAVKQRLKRTKPALKSFGHNPFSQIKNDSGNTINSETEAKHVGNSQEIPIKAATFENNPFIVVKTRPVQVSVLQKYSTWWQ
ncbi:hypothetical protein BJ508DRAFT_414676 [Ascobolus immersus RN42]|uniref:Azaphilone pigments biosynthesis cluster protein L N-terminal domain-containing protein n=1 Tax=Ascobolus immersus RN42 TaxID=1160509 RepID=A0A3N4I6A3_ASCIM|nr:hypothetical protein BJ508DRAFT_414676 [Ascobolus immersus RN42]